MKIKTKFFFLLMGLILTKPHCQNPAFPLWGSTWLVMQGENQRVLYPSVSPMEPKTVIKISFGSKNRFGVYSSYLNWANLNHHDYAVTSEVIADIKLQFQKPAHLIETYDKDDAQISMFYQKYDDTVYSCAEALANSPPVYTEYFREASGAITKFGLSDKSNLKSSPLYAKEKPLCWAKRLMTANDLLVYGNCNDEKCFAGSGATGASFDNYCDDYTDKTLTGQKYCYENQSRYKFKTENLGYWTVHLFPEVWYLCRDPETGSPIFDPKICPKMTPVEAMAMKKKSLEAPNDLTLRKYRNPFLSDSASAIISFSFIDDGTSLSSLKTRDFIWLSAKKSGSKIPYEHYPDRMWQLKSGTYDEQNEALLKSYSQSNAQVEKMKTISSRCPEWEVTDEMNGKKFFPLKDRVNGHFKADKSIDKGNYIYNECPDYPHPEVFNLTTSQMRKIIWQPVPMCSSVSMVNAKDFYTRALKFLKKKEDGINVLNRLTQINEVLNTRKKIANYDKKNENFCPEHIVDQFYK